MTRLTTITAELFVGRERNCEFCVRGKSLAHMKATDPTIVVSKFFLFVTVLATLLHCFLLHLLLADFLICQRTIAKEKLRSILL